MTPQSLPPKGYRSPAALAGLPENTAVLVGFSGGADSYSLLHILSIEARHTGARIVAAHVNHGIRGEEADRDEEFCRRAAEALGVEFFSCRADVPALSRELGKSVELTARDVRYDFFDRLMQEEKISLLVTAHHADDNLETVLFHLVRGTGLSGICGIPLCRPTKHGVLVRPLLDVPREAILDYCQTHQLSYVIDSTNTDAGYTRNRIRSEVIPALRLIQGNTAVAEKVTRMTQSLRADSLYLQAESDRFLEKARLEDGSLPLEAITAAPEPIANRALMSLFSEKSGNKDLERCHVDAIRTLCQRAIPHSSLSLPSQMECVIENQALLFQKQTKSPPKKPYRKELSEGKVTISETNTEIFIHSSQKPINIYKNSILLSIDSATINGVLFARNREDGDRIRLGGMSRSIKKMYCDKKIPAKLRHRLPILCDAQGVVAVPMLGVRDGSAASPQTDKTLWIQISLK